LEGNAMADTEKKAPVLPDCYGRLDIVFPMTKDGLRDPPLACRACVFKTECLRDAMQQKQGLAVKEEQVDRAYSGGIIGFFERWSKKKALHRKRKEKS
jgi:hypothetical protein